MRYIIIETDKAYEKFEIEKKHLLDVGGMIDMIIDTEENKYFTKDIWTKQAEWHDMKPYDKRFED